MLLKNNIVRAILTAALPIIATIVDNFTGEWMLNGKIVNLYQTGKLWVLVLHALFIALIWYTAVEEQKKQKNNEQEKAKELQLQAKEKEILAYENELKSMRDVFDFSQDAINKLTKSFVKNKQLDLREWNFEAVATYICKGVYSAIAAAAEKGSNFTVNIYVKEHDDKNEYITMIAHEGENLGDPPNIFGVRRLLKNSGNVHYSMKQFIDNNPKINVLPDKKSVRKAFNNYKDSYNQYVGIPICCKGNNMISLLEIVAHDDCIIATNKSEILAIVNKYAICYQYFALLAHKIEKNMITTIDVMNVGKEDENGEK